MMNETDLDLGQALHIVSGFGGRREKESEEDRLKTLLRGKDISEGHYDRHFADDAIERMYYEDEDGDRHRAPYFTEEEIEDVFEHYKDDISDYTIHDLSVTMNMLCSDNNRFLEKYAHSESEKKAMVTCMAIEYLQDPDAPHPTSKIWWYMNG